MTDITVIDVEIKPRDYHDPKTGLVCIGTHVFVVYAQHNHVYRAYSATPGRISNTKENQAFEREAFLRRASKW